MPALHKNRVKMTVTSVASAGVGPITLNAASSAHQSFGTAYGANATVDILITEGTSWEIVRNCTYTHSGTTVDRGTLEASSTGSAVAFTSAATVEEILTAARGNSLESALQAVTPGGRLTLESGVPISTTDQTAKTNIYYTPYVHNIINLWDGANWVPTVFTEKTLALGTLTNGKAYDVFGYLSAGALVLELGTVWSSDTARAAGSGGVSLQDGRYCKGAAGSEDKTRLHLGSFYTTSTTTTEDSGGGSTTQVGGKRFLWNRYNKVLRIASVIDTTDNWSYTTGTWRQKNGATGNKVEVLLGDASDAVQVSTKESGYVSASSAPSRIFAVGIGVDSTSSPSGLRQSGYLSVTSGGINGYVAVGSEYAGIPGLGYHYFAELEYGQDAATCLFIGDNIGDGQQTGLILELLI